MRRLIRILIAILIVGGLIVVGGWLLGLRNGDQSRARQFLQWSRGDEAERAELITVRREACPGAPFILPSDGFIGLLYNDPNGPYSSASPHQGIDIFSDALPCESPVYAAYDFFITRDPEW